jgi:hypothetical protein
MSLTIFPRPFISLTTLLATFSLSRRFLLTLLRARLPYIRAHFFRLLMYRPVNLVLKRASKL